MTQATGSNFFTQAMAVATANTSSTALPELLAFVGSRLGQTRANQLIAKVGHLLTVEQQYTLKETYLYGSSRLGVKNQYITLSSRVASVQNGSLMPVGNAMLNTDSVFTGTATALGLPKAPSSRVFHRSWGLKQYELSNHLGNVQVTVSDKKMGVVGTNNVDFTSYQAEVKSATDYYAYGMEMPGKAYQSTAYRYGMNTQEKDDEIYGPGNVFSALYWEYDARLARRWNVDPVVKEYEGAYTPFSGNPIWFVDINGSDTDYVDVNGANLECRPGGADVTIKESISANAIVVSANKLESQVNQENERKNANFVLTLPLITSFLSNTTASTLIAPIVSGYLGWTIGVTIGENIEQSAEKAANILSIFIPQNKLKQPIDYSKGGKQNLKDDEISHLSQEEWSKWKIENKDQKLRIKREEKRRGEANKQSRKSRGY